MMDWQLLTAAIVISLAGGYLMLRAWRTWRGTKNGCSGGCGCTKSTAKQDASEPVLIPADQLVLRK